MGHIRLNTAVPGPRSLALSKTYRQFVASSLGTTFPVFMEKGRGALLEDVDGNVYIDFVGAVGTMNVGHCDPEVVAAIQEQTASLIHTCSSTAHYASFALLAQKLCEITPGDHAKKAVFFNSGAEAVENAVKVARKFTKKAGIISFERGFHGRTLLTMSLTNKLKPYKYDLGPYAPMTFRANFPYTLHRPKGLSEEDYIDYELKRFRDFFLTGAAPEEVAAVLIEVVQGEGGFVIAPKVFIEGVYQICREHGILFIVDEVQTGFGRTGKMFASEHYDIEPDVIIVSKSLGAGIPISGIVGRAEILDAPAVGELGGTYSGSPLGCVAGLAIIDKLLREDLPGRANTIGREIKAHCTRIQREFPHIAEIRGLGAMCAIELMDPESGNPMPEATKKIQQFCFQHGVLINTAGPYNNVLRFLCPLVISDDQLSEGLGVLHLAFKKVLG
jgi:4-aminobutyrate aminotransferase / (S)-3-amino-2-methylpropionate transaminase / 5-aminovalerate transaminase